MDLYGYEIAKRLQKANEGEPLFKGGTVYPVLRALSANGLLTSRIVPSYSGPPRRYYLNASTYGAPEEVAVAYRDTEAKVNAALRPVTPRGIDSPNPLRRFFGVYSDPRAYLSLFYMLLTLVPRLPAVDAAGGRPVYDRFGGSDFHGAAACDARHRQGAGCPGALAAGQAGNVDFAG